MLIYLDELGNVAQSVTERVGRNSNDASVIYVVSYFPAASAVYMTFTLPNGKSLFGGLVDGATGEDIPQTASLIGSIGEGMTVWRYSVPQAVTALSGVVSYTIYAQNGEVRSSAAGTFTVAKGNRIVLPESPTEDAWDQILDRLSTEEGNIDELFALFDELETRLQAVENPTGDVAPDETKVVSGGKIFTAVKDAKDEALASAKEYADHPCGDVAPDETLPASGGRIYTAIKAVAAPLENRVAALEETVEGIPFYFTTVEDLAVKHDVPAAALPYASIDKIGGHTMKCNNLFAGCANATINEQGYLVAPGYNFSDLEKEIPIGTVVSCSIRLVSGKPPSAGNVSLENLNCSLQPDTPDGYVKSENVTVNSSTPYVYFSPGWEGCELEIMINEGATVLPWEPYFEGLKSAKVKAVKSYGKNLYDGQAEFALNGSAVQKIVCTPNIDGPTTFSYKWTGERVNAASIFYFVYEDGTDFKLAPTSLSCTHTKKIKEIWLYNWCYITGRLYDIQLERGSTATEYKPYVGLLDTYTVPSEVQAFEGYGLGITDNRNSADFSDREYTKKCKEIDLGTLDFLIYNSNERRTVFTAQIDDIKEFPYGSKVSPNILCANYRTVAQEDTWVVGDIAQSYSAGDNRSIRIAESPSMTLDDFLEKINGVKLLYVLAEPSTDDISAYITSTVYLKVEGGGYVVAENDEGLEAPLTMTYQIKTNPTI